MKIAKVIIEHPVASLDTPFDYYIPPVINVLVGTRVEVEFNNRVIVGYVEDILDVKETLDEYEEEVGFEIRPILRCLDQEAILTPELRELAHYIAQITVSPLISCYQVMLPPSLKPTSSEKVGIKTLKAIRVINEDFDNLTTKQKESLEYFIANPNILKKDSLISDSIIKTLVSKDKIELFDLEVYRNPLDQDYPLIKGPKLTLDQERVIKEFENSNDSIYLLEGVTGSGKTEVYLTLVEKCLARNKEAIVLVPEISLTPQMVRRFKERLGSDIAVFHSGLTSGQKYDEYRRVARGEVKVVIGARSAIFTPLKNLGLIVIDEEHSESYKQDNAPSYHVLDVASFRIKYNNAKMLLGSATPSLESTTRAIKGVYHPLYIQNRINKMELPNVEIVNMLNETRKRNFIFSSVLKKHIEETLAKNQQIILLLNRRGYASSMSCRSCGYTFECPNCEVPLNFHTADNKLKCHYCGYEEEVKELCPNCGGKYIRKNGMGTQRVEDEIKALFPTARTIRMDYDSVQKEKGYNRILESFGNHEYDILLGTQMIAKGLDFKNVTLVGVLNADIGLYQTDFRSGERTFQLLTQVVGRSGRGEDKGIAVIQTYNPDNYAIKLASKHDFKSFYVQEMAYRKKGLYPPYRYLVSLTFLSKSLDDAEVAAENIKSFIINNKKEPINILGPVQPYIPKVNNKYRLRIMIKYKNKELMYELLQELKDMMMNYKKVEMHVDTSPYQDN
ncbi:MAG: primosomal protein N' [Bacilli bacterium]|nr:primosomal protein N' [Bacilli bacterium]